MASKAEPHRALVLAVEGKMASLPGVYRNCDRRAWCVRGPAGEQVVRPGDFIQPGAGIARLTAAQKLRKLAIAAYHAARNPLEAKMAGILLDLYAPDLAE